MGLLPWQEPAWQAVARFWCLRRWPHALLITGPLDSGKSQFAKCLVYALLCERPTKDFMPCGICSACKLLRAGNHPDWLMIDGSTEIKIETIRDLVMWGNITGQQSDRRVVVIASAGSMNRAASNALLKFLEEPSSNVIMILTAEQSQQLDLTVASRCQQLQLTLPTAAELRTWLAPQIPNFQQLDLVTRISEGRPYLALRYLEANLLNARTAFIRALLTGSEIVLNETLRSENLSGEMIWQIWISIVNDLLKSQMGLKSAIINLDFTEDLARVSQKITSLQLLKFLDRLLMQVKAAARKINLNTNLQRTALAVHWHQLLLQQGGELRC